MMAGGGGTLLTSLKILLESRCKKWSKWSLIVIFGQESGIFLAILTKIVPGILTSLKWNDELQDDFGHLFLPLIESPTGKTMSHPNSNSAPGGFPQP